MNVVQKFLRPEKQEPVPPPLPPRVHPEKRKQLALDFMDEHSRTLEENAYLRSEVEQLRVELKVAQEKARMLESELNFLRDEYDRLLTHDKYMLGGIDAIEAAIINLKASSRAEAYAPPGSGSQDETADQAIDHAAELAKKLAPETEGNADGA